MSIRPLIIATIVCVCAGLFLYPVAIYQLYGRYVPEAWSVKTLAGTTGGIKKALGPPYYEMAVKSTLQWRIDYWWGYKQLDVMADNINNTDSKPDYIDYVVHVKGYDFLGHIFYKAIGGTSTISEFRAYFGISRDSLIFAGVD